MAVSDQLTPAVTSVMALPYFHRPGPFGQKIFYYPERACNFASAICLSRYRWVLPLMVLGNSATNSTSRGYLYGAIDCLAPANSCSLGDLRRVLGVAPLRSTMNACTSIMPWIGWRAMMAPPRAHPAAEQCLLDLGPGDVVASRDDHVVAARLEPEVAVGVADVGVAGDVPAVPHVASLALVGQVAAAGRTLDGEPSRLSVGYLVAVGVQDGRPVAGHGVTGRAGPDGGVGGCDEDVQHLGRTDAIDDRDAGGLVELLPDRLRQVLAGRDAASQVLTRRCLPRGQHGPVGGGRGGQYGHAVSRDRVG